MSASVGAARVDVGEAQGEARCPLCRTRAPVGGCDPACRACGVRVHEACAREMPGCPTLGCASHRVATRGAPGDRLAPGAPSAAARVAVGAPRLDAFALDVIDTTAFTATFAGAWVLVASRQVDLVGASLAGLALVGLGLAVVLGVARARARRARGALG